MQKKSQQQAFQVTLKFPNGLTRTVTKRASTRQGAEKRALKHHPNATGVVRGQ